MASHLCSKNTVSKDRDYRDKYHIWMLCTALILLPHDWLTDRRDRAVKWEVAWKEQGYLALSQPSVDVALLFLHPHKLIYATQCWARQTHPALAAAEGTLHCTLLQIPKHPQELSRLNKCCLQTRSLHLTDLLN